MKESPAASRYAAEFIGTFLLVFTIACNVHTESVATALSVGFVLMAAVYALGPVSGGHFNPAVTFSVGLAGRSDLSIRDVAGYMVFQALGSVAGAFLYWHVIGRDLLLRPLGVYTGPQAASVEVIYTAALCYVFLGVYSGAGNPNGHFGLAVGCALTSMVVAAGPISGCSLNPAVAIASICVAHMAHGSAALNYYGLYTCTPFAGAVIGAFLFHVVHGTQAAAAARQGGIGFVEEESVEAPAPPGEDAWLTTRRLSRASNYSTMAMEEAPATSIRVVRHETVTLPQDIVDHNLYFGSRWLMKKEVRRGQPVETVDIDLACVKFNRHGECVGGVYFAEKIDAENNIRHSGDDIMGSEGATPRHRQKGNRDDEVIKFRLSDVKANIVALVFVVMIYTPEEEEGQKRQSFGDVQQIYVRLVDELNGGQKEICHYDKQNLALNSNALIAAIMYRKGESWCFKCVDESYTLAAHSTYRRLIPEMAELCRDLSREAASGYMSEKSARTV